MNKVPSLSIMPDKCVCFASTEW